ncbi:MAG: amidohydrolase/deacetylase family metallohydrolase [Bryobacterales bacterium]|nr:amidohydrolase/deacetylase family metallohydrolase [Bryobacterales bacterium]
MRFSLLLFLAGSLLAQGQYDLLLKGGHVIDPKNGISAKRDVAIQDGKIAAVAESIDASRAYKVVNVSDYYVTPGLIDIHVHVYAGTGMRGAYSGDNSIYPDGHTFRVGVTTVVDAGSSGWRNFEDFKDRVIDRSKTRVLALLNIVGRGMGGGDIEQNVQDMDAQATAAMAKKHPQVVVGVKTAHFSGPEWVAVDRAVEAGNAANVPVMVDFGRFRQERPFEELVTKRLRPGDIYTHAFLGAVPLLDEKLQVRPFMHEARKRGVIFDVGHGGGSLLFRQAVPAVKQGFLPDSISTDIHITSMNAGMKDMLNVMSKFINMGMSVDDVILRSTWNPAKQIKRQELGHLTVGAVADVAVLNVLDGKYGFTDIAGTRMRGDRKFECELTIKDGKVHYDLNGITRRDWDGLGIYDSQGDPRWDATIGGGGGGRRRGGQRPR